MWNVKSLWDAFYLLFYRLSYVYHIKPYNNNYRKRKAQNHRRKPNSGVQDRKEEKIMADFENKNNTQWNENNAAQNGASAPNAAGTADSVKNAAQNTSGAGYNTNPTDTGSSANGAANPYAYQNGYYRNTTPHQDEAVHSGAYQNGSTYGNPAGSNAAYGSNPSNVNNTASAGNGGSGNNGGDGYAIARMLMQAGNTVDVLEAPHTGKASVGNQLQKKIFLAYGGKILTEFPEGKSYTLVIDAVFGVGLSRSVEGEYASLIDRMNAMEGAKAAVDIASGISADNGNVLGTAFRADLTVTFAFEKVGCLLWPGNQYAGKVVVADIGITPDAFGERKPAVAALEDADLSLLAARESHSNKGTFGRLLVIAGSQGMSGAAYLCAKAAYASGCGLVRIFTPEENRAILQTQLPEAVITAYSSKRRRRRCFRRQ